ncbi:hypothetical protein [Acerihabitans arboris]|uniref:Uncharacterized protein n=1 Tax=Acerihabitans arboris TaxID=2691583 RepID=A0A845SE91_9GAMM|nr:hypothetical protein [Acerihabitans arboris]NDL61396.1 hypothetical protein [Acerihabitans arboris]
MALPCTQRHSAATHFHQLTNIQNKETEVSGAAKPAVKSNFSPGFHDKLAKAGNSLQKLLTTVERRAGAFAGKLGKMLARLSIGGKKGTATASKDANDIFQQMLTRPQDRTVAPKNLIGTLLKDGSSLEENGKAIKSFLIDNPNSPLFSSENITISPYTDDNGKTGYKMSFKQPEQIPNTAIIVKELAIDSQDGRSGEFRGKLALWVLQHPDLQFGSLAGLCALMTMNDQFNVVKMRTAHMIADRLNDPAARAVLDTPQNAAAIDSLVTYNTNKAVYEPKFSYPLFSDQPFSLNDGGAAFGTAADADGARKRVAPSRAAPVDGIAGPMPAAREDERLAPTISRAADTASPNAVPAAKSGVGAKLPAAGSDSAVINTTSHVSNLRAFFEHKAGENRAKNT